MPNSFINSDDQLFGNFGDGNRLFDDYTDDDEVHDNYYGYDSQNEDNGEENHDRSKNDSKEIMNDNSIEIQENENLSISENEEEISKNLSKLKDFNHDNNKIIIEIDSPLGSRLVNPSQRFETDNSEKRLTTRFDFQEHIQETSTPLQNIVPPFKLKNFPSVSFGEKNITNEDLDTCQQLFEALEMRRKTVRMKYPWETNNIDHPVPETPKDIPINPLKMPIDDTPATDETFYFDKGVMICSKFKPSVSFQEHYKDFKKLKNLIWNAPTKAFCHSRLKLLEFKFSLYKALYSKNELTEQKNVKHRDFYNVRKVDNHVHLASSMNQKHLLKFIKRKLRDSGDEKVLKVDNKILTLDEVFQSLNLTAYDLNVDSLEVHAGGKAVAHRFDKFNTKYNPFGQSELREIFLKSDNYIKGKYFSEICMQVFNEMDESKYILSEPRISVYGRKKEEWDNLAEWVVDNNMFCNNIRWMIQIPRLYHVHKKTGSISTFQDMLDNIFTPLFEVTKDPSSHPKLHKFLKVVVAFDHVDDESKAEGQYHSKLVLPDLWCTKDNPAYSYYNYFFWANLNVLNQYRESKGLNTIAFRPHSGEAGDISHLISSYLLADGISHGIEVRHTPVLEYLFYLSQFGMSLSPLSNNHLFLKYSRNPFPRFFARGLNVSLSTDDPLMFHFTKEPLMEEYSIAAQVWHFSAADKCEIARNSVLQSGFPTSDKQYWISPNFDDYGPRSNQVERTNVPNLRMQYRYETLMEEHLYIQKCLHIFGKNENAFLKIRPRLTLEETHTLIDELKSATKFAHINLNSTILRPYDANQIVPIKMQTNCMATSTDDLPSKSISTQQTSIVSHFPQESNLPWKHAMQAFMIGTIPVALAAIGVIIGISISKNKN